MPEEGVELKPKEHYMTSDEVVILAKKFVELGVKKIRLTGGEPFLRKDAGEIIARLAELPVDLGVTTNGILLDRFIDQIKTLNIKLNVSLDSLQKERNFKIVKRDYFDRIMQNINAAVEQGIIPSMNCVLMAGVNEEEIIDFVELTKDTGLRVRFIEFMPFNGNQWQLDKCVSHESVLQRVYDYYGRDNVEALPLDANHVAENFKIKNYRGTFGLISTVTKPFCSDCNRIRLTADGQLKNCLFSETEVDLLSAVRKGLDLNALISQSMSMKAYSRGGIIEMDDDHLSRANENRSMITIGG